MFSCSVLPKNTKLSAEKTFGQLIMIRHLLFTCLFPVVGHLATATESRLEQ